MALRSAPSSLEPARPARLALWARRWRALRVRTRRTLRRAESRLDHALYAGWRSLVMGLEDLTIAQSRLQPTGWRRVAVDYVSDGLSLSFGAGILAVGLGMPAFALTRGADAGNGMTLPGLPMPTLAISIEDRTGHRIGQRGALRAGSVPLAEIPETLVQALVAIEDRRFFHHHGIDVLGTARAFSINARQGGVVQGGSSLTQQLAKNLFLSGERTLRRKITEAYLALWLEGHLSKAQILQLYLDRTYLGDGTFGVEAAAQHYFGKSVRAVTLPEAAMLAGLFKAPTRDAPTKDLPAAQRRADQVLQAMTVVGTLTPGQALAARRTPAAPAERPAPSTPDYYLDLVSREVAELAKSGVLGAGSNFTAQTAFEPALQSTAEDALNGALTRIGPDDTTQGAMVVMDPDGALRALVGGRDYGQSQFDRATQAQRQPGSAFKPFVYTAALLNGYTPESLVRDEPLCIRTWCPKNYGGHYAGLVSLATALRESINTVPVRLSLALGSDAVDGRRKIIDIARRMGVSSPLRPGWALPLGVESVNLLEMTGAYGVFASGGHQAPPHTVLSVRNDRGETVYRRDPQRDNPLVVSPPIIAAMNGMLAGVVEDGTGRAARLPGIRAAGKTGTTDDYRDAWFLGFTGDRVGGVWIGRDDDTPLPGITGGTEPARVWQAVMQAAHQGLAPAPIPGVAPLPGARAAHNLSRDGTAGRTGSTLLATAEASLPPYRYAAQADWTRVPGTGGVRFADGVWTLGD